MQSILITGIKTNNLKSIDIAIPHNKIIAITGISGGGKTSLAYNTIYSLCHQEFKALESGYFEDANYDVANSSGLIPAVAIKQKNSNTNPRSTIYSYLNISSMIAAAKHSIDVTIPLSLLKLNSPSNECNACSGMGKINSININKVANRDTPLKDNPFFPWKSSNSDKHYKLFMSFCKNENIDTNKSLNDLDASIIHKILYGISDNEFKISFKHNGKPRTRNLKYIGVLQELQEQSKSDKISLKNIAHKYSDLQDCPSCLGTRVESKLYSSYRIDELKFIDLLSQPIDTLIKKINHINNNPLQPILYLLQTLSHVGLGYLNLSRSIPSLSGGELQKLNFSKLLNSNISNIAVIIDEISSQLHVSDFNTILKGVSSIKDKGNTVILVEHNQHFIDFSDIVFTIGPKPGKSGGYLIENIHSNKHDNVLSETTLEITDFTKFIITKQNNITNLTVKFPTGKLTAIVGRSGSGKSSIAEYISSTYPNIVYVSQSLIKGNIRSSISTILNLNNKIADFYSKNTGEATTLFNPSSGNAGACSACNGTGIIRYERTYEKSIDTLCNQCNGKLFSSSVDSYKVNNISVSELYSLDFEQLSQTSIQSSAFSNLINAACSLGLGHLSLNRKTQSLSGGELRRLKLLNVLIKRSTNKKVLIIDEPGAGLDDVTAAMVIAYIKTCINKFHSIIIIDHKPSIFSECDHIIEVGPGAGDKGGKIIYEGNSVEYYNNHYLPYLTTP